MVRERDGLETASPKKVVERHQMGNSSTNVVEVAGSSPRQVGRTIIMATSSIFAHNRGADDVFLTVVDLNSFNKSEVVKNKRLNVDETMKIDVEINGKEQSLIKWAAISAQDNSIKMEGEETLEASDEFEVYV